MVAGDQPLLPIPLVGERIAGFHTGAGLLKGEGVKASLDHCVAIDFDFTRVLRISGPCRLVHEKMMSRGLPDTVGSNTDYGALWAETL